jgi:hypothetical protein
MLQRKVIDYSPAEIRDLELKLLQLERTVQSLERLINSITQKLEALEYKKRVKTNRPRK